MTADYLIERARALRVPAEKLAERVAWSFDLCAPLERAFALIARPGEGEVTFAVLLAPKDGDEEGQLAIPRGWEFVVGARPNGPGELLVLFTHDDDCPALTTSLLISCRCRPDVEMLRVE